MKKIGITYLKGSVPGFEKFGNLPTDFVDSNGLVNGVKASEELDALIIPGGTIIETKDYNEDFIKEVKKMAGDGKPVIGICAGFQILGNTIDIGRKSEVPIIKEGIGLIDVSFSPLISSDRVEAKVYNNSFLTEGQDENITGFHTHTYGKVEGDAKPLFYSKIQRMNYRSVNADGEYNVFSGACNDDGNVIGTMVHNFLDENPLLVDNLFKYIGADEDEIADVYKRNQELKSKLDKEIGVKTGIYPDGSLYAFKNNGNGPRFLMIGSNGSDSGKTFISTGLAGALKKGGLKVGLMKVGPDARDIVPGLYLTKGLMEDFSSIKIGNLGWMDIEKSIAELKKSDYDIVLIEGVMSVFTGLLNETVPYSASEIAASSDIPMLLISGVNKGGIESAAVDLASHVNMLKKFGISVEGILLNKIYSMDIFENVKGYIKKSTGVENILSVEKLKLEKRGNTPEIEIRYDMFSKIAMDTVERNLDISLIAGMAKPIEFKGYLNFQEIKEKFI